MSEVFMGPQLAVPRISLISSADDATPEGDRWFQQFQVYAEGCPEYGTYPVCPPTDEDSKDDERQDTDNPTYFPYVIYSWDNCSSWGFSSRDAWGRANRKLQVSESFLLEQQLWTDSLGLGNPHLADAPNVTTVTSYTQSPKVALAEMDQALANINAGRGMIHVRPRVLAFLVFGGTVRREGNLYLSPMDNIVVPGRGYPGTGPAGQPITASTEWIYATSGIVQIRRSAVSVLPGYDDYSAAMNRPNNDIIVRSEKVVHAALDPNCGIFAFEVDLSDATEL